MNRGMLVGTLVSFSLALKGGWYKLYLIIGVHTGAGEWKYAENLIKTRPCF